MSTPLGAAGNVEEVLVGAGDGGMVGIEGSVFLRTRVGINGGVFLRTAEESQIMCLLRPQTPPVGLVQPQKP